MILCIFVCYRVQETKLMCHSDASADADKSKLTVQSH